MSDEIRYYAKMTMLPAESLRLVETIATPTTLKWRFSDGREFSHPRDPIDIGNLTFSYRALSNGKYFYRYILDNRLVQMVRVGEFTHNFGLSFNSRVGQPILRGPDGWTELGVGWCPSWTGPVTRTEAAEYVILSDYLPGLLPLHLAGAEKTRRELKLPFTGDGPQEHYVMQEIYGTIAQYETSADPWVIGPVFRPQPAEQEVRDHISSRVRWGFEFLRPLDGASVNLKRALDAVVPQTSLEMQTFECLKLAIREMIADKPAAAQIESARAARKARRSLSTRGVKTLEEAQHRLRSLRSAQNILGIVRWKTSAARQKDLGLGEMESQQDARLEAITKSKSFTSGWKMLAQRVSTDEAYYTKLIRGVDAALERLNNRIEFLHSAYDLKVSLDACQTELAKACVANLEKIRAESVMGIHLCEEEAKASLSPENWQLVIKNQYGPDIVRKFDCQAGTNRLRAEVWTDSTDEKIGSIRLQLVVQVVVRYQDGSEHLEMFESNTMLTVLGVCPLNNGFPC